MILTVSKNFGSVKTGGVTLVKQRILGTNFAPLVLQQRVQLNALGVQGPPLSPSKGLILKTLLNNDQKA